MERISSIVNGKDRILAIWEGRTDTELYGITKSTAREIENTFLRMNRIKGDVRLSDQAKREDSRGAGLDSLKNLAKSAIRLEALRTQHKERANRLAAVTPYRDGDAATALIDMEIARKLASMPNATARAIMLVNGEQPRLTEAVLRLPAFLSGLSDAEYGRIASAAIERAHPEQSRAIAQEADELDAASKAVEKAFSIIAGETHAPLDDQVAAAGEHAEKLVKTAPEAIANIQRRQAEQEDEQA
ncbi:hypothetical protein [Stutzerimonas nitrititolerans]|uniref:hypothetical protein n=1 Tax=Stutzerimonas nitrititolerans TaxID=2482751 RepID=UPI0028A85025|nr:hypothetical protein [Stutzerimonas nitrititolerans]